MSFSPTGLSHEGLSDLHYYPFGMVMPGTDYTDSKYTGGYRYGFNGKEIDSEISGTDNQYDYGFRIYNPRLGKFLSVDPLFQSYPWYTPYQFAGNMPISAIDLDGLEEYIMIYISPDTRPLIFTRDDVEAGDPIAVALFAFVKPVFKDRDVGTLTIHSIENIAGSTVNEYNEDGKLLVFKTFVKFTGVYAYADEQEDVYLPFTRIFLLKFKKYAETNEVECDGLFGKLVCAADPEMVKKIAEGAGHGAATGTEQDEIDIIDRTKHGAPNAAKKESSDDDSFAVDDSINRPGKQMDNSYVPANPGDSGYLNPGLYDYTHGVVTDDSTFNPTYPKSEEDKSGYMKNRFKRDSNGKVLKKTEKE